MSAQKIHAGFESAFMRSLPPETLEKILIERGGADLATVNALTKIDKLLQNRAISLNGASAADLERAEQWLRIALSNPKLIDDLVDRIPTMGARESAELLSKLLSLLGETKSAGLRDVMAKLLSNVFNFTGDGKGGSADKVAGDDKNISADKNVGADKSAGDKIVDGKVAADKIIGDKIADGKIIGDKIINDKIADGKIVSGGGGNIVSDKSAAFENILRTAFTSAPAALLDLVKQLGANEAVINRQLSGAEAQKTLDNIIARLPQIENAAKADNVHDAKALLPQTARAEIAPAQNPQEAALRASAAQIRAEYTNLLDTAVGAFLNAGGGGGSKRRRRAEHGARTVGYAVEIGRQHHKTPRAAKRGQRE